MSNRFGGGMSDSQKMQRITDILENCSPDVMDLIYRILFMVDSGLE